MTRLFLPAALLAFATAAGATPIPLFDATCGESVEVHGDQGGPIYIDGAAVTPKAIGESAYEATRNGITISVTVFEDDSIEVRYADPEGSDGLCRLRRF